MKKITKLFVLTVFLLSIVSACFVGCDKHDDFVDYVSQLTLDMESTSLKEEVTVRNYVDGDTTHFHISKSAVSTGVMKARYLAINTPESTGRIEDYGKAASNFTKEKLKSATSIIVESDDGNWNTDANGRHLVWVWYRTSDDAEYRNLNLEILQNGLAIASNTAQNRYGDICINALNQAEKKKLNVFSGNPDPDMYHGEAQELTLKELRCNIESYSGIKVAFEGVVAENSGGSIYVEEYDEDSGVYFGMPVYYGTANLSSSGLNIIEVGNRVRIVGTVQYYETGGTWQISGIQYKPRDPQNPNNIQKISDGHAGAYPLVGAETFLGKITIVTSDDDNIEMDYAQAALNSTISMNDLTVVSVYTTKDPASSSVGAMTLTCKSADGQTISVRTTVFHDENGVLITEDAYKGKTINVKGIVDYFDGKYQIKVFAPANITIAE